MRLTFRRSARAELIEAIAWFADYSEASGLRFEAAVERALDMITEMPEVGALLTPIDRRLVVPRYPYQVVYRIVRDRIVVIAVAHTSREPGYWRNRG